MALYENPDVKPSETKPDFEIPEGFEDEDDFLKAMRQELQDDLSFDKLNRDAALEDLKFAVGDQWDTAVRAKRAAARKPTLTINRIPAFVAQIVGNRRQNETTIKIQPEGGGDISVARVREGLIRSIQKISRAELAYDKACESQVICGIGNFSVELDYENDDVFEQTIKVCQIPDPLAVVWDRMLTDPTGADAGHCFVVDGMPNAEFKRRWPWAAPADITVDLAIYSDLRANGWVGIDDVRVVSYWRICRHKRTLALMQDGSTLDITESTDKKSPTYEPQVAQQILSGIVQRKDGSPIMREVQKPYAEMYLCSGTDILEGPYRLPISRVPVFRVPGWEVNVGEYKHRWGLVRFLKDPQRLHNYWRSIIAEKIMQTPRAKWLAGKGAVQGVEKDYRNSHLSDDPLLTYDETSSGKPEIIAPASMEESLMSQAEFTAQDIKDVSNIHEANLGMPSNEVSGAAIMARQRVSDTGTILYHDNLNMAIEEAGKVINQLIPTVYDTPRIIKVLGEDGKQDLVAINNTAEPHNDITAGKYEVSVATGASFQTKRIEAVQSMSSFINAAPQVAGYVMDLIAKNMDWPGADEFVRRIQFTLPPGMLDPKDMTPEMQQRAQQQGQQSQQQQQLQMQMAMANYLKMQSETAVNNARAQNFQAEAEAAPNKLATDQMTAASMASERELSGHLEAIKVATGA